MNVSLRNNLPITWMIKQLLPIVVALSVVGCSSQPKDIQSFDDYLADLMAEPYDPNNGSKYWCFLFFHSLMMDSSNRSGTTTTRMMLMKQWTSGPNVNHLHISTFARLINDWNTNHYQHHWRCWSLCNSCCSYQCIQIPRILSNMQITCNVLQSSWRNNYSSLK